MLVFAIVQMLVAAPVQTSTVTSSAVERLVVKTDKKLRTEVDAYGATVRVFANGATDAVMRALKVHPSRLCPEAKVEKGEVVFTCVTQRLEASATEVAGGVAIDFRQLRGLPWRKTGGGPPLRSFAPELVSLGGACPGTRPAGRAECALSAGKIEEAKGFLREATATGDASYAWLRVGDLALQDGDALAAIEAFKKAGDKGPWGRLATARQCEVLGGCLEENGPKVFNPIALAEPLRRELELRGVRADAMVGNLERAMRSLLALNAERGRGPVCGQVEDLCDAMVRAALKTEDRETKAAGLEVWAALQPKVKSLPLTVAAAEASAALGAPRYAADLLASATAEVPAENLEAHLLKVVGNYLAAEDKVRAGVIVDFARGRLGDKALTSGAWRPVLAAFGKSKPAKIGVLPVGTAQAIAAECQRADAVLEAASKIGSAKETP